jgi:hypothetical protein
MLGINVRKRNSFSISACFMQFRNNIGSAGVGFGHGADYTKYLVTRILQYYDNIIQTGERGRNHSAAHFSDR